MKKIKASVKNYRKLIKQGKKPLFPVFTLSHSVKHFVVFKDNYFIYQN